MPRLDPEAPWELQNICVRHALTALHPSNYSGGAKDLKSCPNVDTSFYNRANLCRGIQVSKRLNILCKSFIFYD